MNVDFSYYDACYKLCVLNTILNTQENLQVSEIDLSDNLTALTRCYYSVDDGLAGYDYSEFRLEFRRNDKIIDQVVFPNNYKIATQYQSKLWDDSYSIDLRLEAMKALMPSSLSKFLQHKPLLTPEERNLVIAKAQELEKIVMEQKANESKHM